MRWAMLSLVPLKKLSAHSTSLPSATSRSQRCEPRNPAPPVTRIRLRNESFIFLARHLGEDRVPAAHEALDAESLERRSSRFLAQTHRLRRVLQQFIHVKN